MTASFFIPQASYPFTNYFYAYLQTFEYQFPINQLLTPPTPF
jgi:hypothetical protein